MASWDQVKNFIRSNYKVQNDEGDFFKMVFDLSNDRTQMVFVQKVQTKQNGIWIQISSPVGIIGQEKMNKALETLNDKVCGGLVKIGDKHFVRHCMPIDDMSLDEFAVPLTFITSSADDLEKKFVGGDEQ
ncbi:hypothetical protein R84B8_00278 [Treponema sp. R8-4-B8]